MSYSLQIANGDLAFNGSDLATIDGSGKMVQDLACCILEPMGTDSMHPWFGSIIDGGTLTNGTYQPGFIGQPNNALVATQVAAEIARICAQYQGMQKTRYEQDVATYGKSTITVSEALMSVENIETIASTDQLFVNATIGTGSGSQPLSLPIGTSS